MAEKRWDRLRRRRRERAAAENVQPNAMDSEEHAWWAARENLDRAYVPPKPKVEPMAPKGNTFTDYFSTESLFTWGEPPRSASGGEDDDGKSWEHPDPYVVLGLNESATWAEILAAHRRLAKLHHPDRLLHATEKERHRSERRMRELNIAYSELRRRRGM